MLKEIISNVSKNVIGNEFNIKISLATIIKRAYFD